MAAKTIQISSDGVTYETMPGNSGDFSAEAAQLSDTVFGYEYSSTQPGLMTWTVNSNALYRGFAGYVASVLRNGSSTAFSPEAMTNVSGNIWQITDTTKRIWDRATLPTVSTGTIDSINYLTGTITFTGTVVDPTVSGNYFPTASLGCSNSFSLTQTSETTDTSCFETASVNGGFATTRATLKTVELELTGFYRATNQFYDLLQGRGELIVEINPDGNMKSYARGYFKPVTDSQSGDVGGDETETISFRLSTPQDVLPFTWVHANDSTIPNAIKILLSAWANSSEVYVRYLPEGEDNEGRQGQAIVTDISLSQSVDGMAEFSCSLQGTGPATAINVASV
jgi:hypothetical protein